ncbi:MAG TPA: hypothetical protein V6C85_06190 [Allocoleopsis sp.]
MVSELNESPKPVSHLKDTHLSNLEYQLNSILDRELLTTADYEVLTKAALVLEQKAYALRLEAAKQAKLNGKKPRKKRQLGVFQGVYLI